jgi:hypothetical protein|tara:strand:+ start:269 stop:445 length:177 start_codon:yes stop_codon:yes gene_type:complete
MNPDKIKIATEREFEYEKISRTIDKMDDIDDVKLMLKYTIKMGMKQTEILGNMLLVKY